MRAETYKRENLRVYAKKFLLTYGQLPQKLTPDSVISQLQEKIEFIHYVLGIEDGGTNVYVVLISEKKLDIRDGSIFDITFCNESKISPNA